MALSTSFWLSFLCLCAGSSAMSEEEACAHGNCPLDTEDVAAVHLLQVGLQKKAEEVDIKKHTEKGDKLNATKKVKDHYSSKLPWVVANQQASCTTACAGKGWGCDAAKTRAGSYSDFTAADMELDDGDCHNPVSEAYAPVMEVDWGESYYCVGSSLTTLPTDYCDVVGPSPTTWQQYHRLCHCDCVDCSGLTRASTETSANRIVDGIAFSLCYKAPTDKCEDYYNQWYGNDGDGNYAWAVKQCSYNTDYGDCRPTTACCEAVAGGPAHGSTAD